jgi:uncharacterized protein
MQPSMFNLRVPLQERGEVFLMNTFTDAQLLVSEDVATLLDRAADSALDAAGVSEAGGFEQFSEAEQEAVRQLAEHGFLVTSRDAERQALASFFRDVREGTDQVRVTVLTTLQCNFACDYCFQGDHGDYNKFAQKMSLETAARVASWIEARLDAVGPESFVLTLFGGEPLLNLPVCYFLAERLWSACQARRVRMLVNVITNGLLLTRDVVDRLAPFGLNGVKVTLDGDRDTHNRMRPLRGGQGTFDKIVENVRQVASRCKVSIGGNFDESSAGSYPALLDFLKEQDFADKLAKVAFKPIIRETPATPKGMIPLTAVDGGGKPLGGTCMTAAGTGTNACTGCHGLDETMSFLRDETKRRGFPTVDGVHMGPCELHKRHAYTINPDGSLYACPGFTGDATKSVGHIDDRRDPFRARAAADWERLAPYDDCGDCPFIPVCAGGCSVAAHTELGDMNKPNCHKSSFEAGLLTLARDAAAQAACAPV